MTRSELIESIAKKNPNLLLSEIEKIVSVIFSSMTGALARGDRVEFRGFGVFSTISALRELHRIREPATRCRLVTAISSIFG